MPAVFACPSFRGSNAGGRPGENRLTTYIAISNTGAAFGSSGTRPVRDFSDGTSDTILVTEVRQSANIWMSPTDVSIAQFQSEFQHSVGSQPGTHKDGIQVLLRDGSARFVLHDTDQKSVDALTTVAADDSVSDEFQ